MKNIFIILLISFLIVKCSYESILPKKTQALIPPNANKIVLLSEIQSDSLYIFVSNLLTDYDFRIINSDKELGYINTDGKFIGEATMMRMNIKIVEEQGLSKLISAADWSVDPTLYETLQQVWKQASKENAGKPDFVYDTMVLIIEKIPHKEIKFIKE